MVEITLDKKKLVYKIVSNLINIVNIVINYYLYIELISIE